MKAEFNKNNIGHRILYISSSVPPIINGPSVLIARLFKHFPDDSYSIFTSRHLGNRSKIDDDFQLSCPYIYTKIRAIDSEVSNFQRDFAQWLEIPVII